MFSGPVRGGTQWQKNKDITWYNKDGGAIDEDDQLQAQLASNQHLKIWCHKVGLAVPVWRYLVPPRRYPLVCRCTRPAVSGAVPGACFEGKKLVTPGCTSVAPPKLPFRGDTKVVEGLFKAGIKQPDP
ncbi:hypothetical protein PSHT_03631 [Puccinia striiformis]|uniref:Uncharacterized protein n=2 Tax=Puccinia striiformis TaxID=27350 RepID=A0A2S4UQF4_9BASI|nr:hypothetical protein PSTT_13833 [Puccinia striiformis]POW20331.1 hypothetical protein PSHT_03631 [Puccinia striiformis]